MRPAIALVAGVVAVIAAAGCSDDDASPSPSPSTIETTTPTPSPADETPEPGAGTPVSDDVIDIAAAEPQLTVLGKASEDLVTGSRNVALGDFNDDGETDLLMGAPQADGPDGSRRDGGEAYVIFGPLAGEIDLLTMEPDITIYGALPGDGLGATAYSGDLNDDGVDDVMVGAPGVTAGFDPRTDQGRLYIFYGGEDLNDTTLFDLAEDVFDMTVTGSEGFSRLSTDVDLGDLNGDGMTDLLVSSPFAGREPGTPPGSDRTGVGEIYVIFGTGETLTGEYNIAADAYDLLLSGDTEFAQFGATFAVGDFNGDGIDDVVTGAHRTAAANGRPSGGAAYVFFGNEDISGRISIQDGQQAISIVGAGPGSALGFPVSAGDFNGDGTDDLAIGAQAETLGALVTAGTVRIFFGGGLTSTIDVSTDEADVTIATYEAGGLFPGAMETGDLTGDGVTDLVLSATLSGSSYSRTSGGLVYMIAGSAELDGTIDLREPPTIPFLGPERDARLGSGIAIGDVDGAIVLALTAPGITPSDDRPKAGAVLVVRVGDE